MARCAQTLVSACSTETFAVSFTSTNPAFPLPVGRSRLYMQNIAAADVSPMVEQAVMTDPEIRMVFYTDVNDTRFDDYGVLRPLETAH